MKTAKDLKIGDTIKRNGLKLTVATIDNDTYKNGTPCLSIGFFTNNSIKVDSFLNFKLDTKVK